MQSVCFAAKGVDHQRHRNQCER